MARFYANIQGNRGEATRMGSALSGLYGHIRGWNIGASVKMSVIDDEDVVSIHLTHGSSGVGYSQYLGSYKLADGKFIKIY